MKRTSPEGRADWADELESTLGLPALTMESGAGAAADFERQVISLLKKVAAES
jgi:hypothetical protein